MKKTILYYGALFPEKLEVEHRGSFGDTGSHKIAKLLILSKRNGHKKKDKTFSIIAGF